MKDTSYAEKFSATEYFDNLETKNDFPEKKLIVAVLSMAIRDYVSGSKQLKKEAYFWIKSNKIGPFSFFWCSQALNCDPDRMREAIFKLTKETWYYKFRTNREESFEVKSSPRLQNVRRLKIEVNNLATLAA